MNDSIVTSTTQHPELHHWLLLIHSLPPKPDYLRVKIRRRLQQLGAAPLKNSVYALRDTDEALEDFQWLAGEIRGEGGEAIICRAEMLGGIAEEEIEAMLQSSGATEPQAPSGSRHSVEPGRTWVTRLGVGVDRMASAWLIRRFIDPGALFKFVPPRGYRPAPGELRFDMYEAEYTHEGERCTFQALLAHFGLSEPGLEALGEIIRDIDCKDVRHGRPETAGVAAMVAGIAEAEPDDGDRLTKSAPLFDGLLASLGSRRK